MIDLGDVQHLSIQVTDDTTGQPADPGAVTLSITLPDGSVATPAVTRPTIGSYICDYPTVQAGRHEVRWVATGAYASTYTDVFQVAAADPALLISLTEARLAIGKRANDTSKDEDLRTFIAAATPILEDLVGPILPRPVTEWHETPHTHPHAHLWSVSLRETPVLSLTSVNGDTDVSPFDFDSLTGVLWPTTGHVLVTSGYYSSGFRIQYVAGRTNVAGNLLLAARRLVKHLYLSEQQSGPQGVRPSVGGDGGVSYTPAGYAVPKAVIELCTPDLSLPGIG